MISAPKFFVIAGVIFLILVLPALAVIFAVCRGKKETKS